MLLLYVCGTFNFSLHYRFIHARRELPYRPRRIFNLLPQLSTSVYTYVFMSRSYTKYTEPRQLSLLNFTVYEKIKPRKIINAKCLLTVSLRVATCHHRKYDFITFFFIFKSRLLSHIIGENPVLFCHSPSVNNTR